MLPLGSLAQASPDDLGPQLDSDGMPRQPVLVIDADADPTPDERAGALEALRSAGAITVAVTRGSEISTDLAAAVDLAIVAGPGARPVVGVADPEAAAATLVARAAEHPVPALALAWLLRGSASQPVREALVAESAVYSTLLAGAEFLQWLAQRGPGRPSDGDHRVAVSRRGDVLSIVLDRAARRNAVDSRMRDALREALSIAVHDPELAVELSAAGPSFSAGGDLDEFGTAADPGTAHLVRVAAAPGALVHRLRDRVTVRLHGACVGAGIEIPAFAGRVVAAPDTFFQLPELDLGLIPGAGGTVSITRRAGRHRLLWMALTGIRVDVVTALGWGLIDVVE